MIYYHHNFKNANTIGHVILDLIENPVIDSRFPARNASPARNAVSTAGWHSDAGGRGNDRRGAKMQIAGKLLLILLAVAGIVLVFYFSWFWTLFLVPMILILGWDFFSGLFKKK